MKILIIFTDDELDCRELKDANGNLVDMKSLIENMNQIYTSYVVVVSRKPPKKVPDTIFEGANNLFHIKPDDMNSQLLRVFESIKINLWYKHNIMVKLRFTRLYLSIPRLFIAGIEKRDQNCETKFSG